MAPCTDRFVLCQASCFLCVSNGKALEWRNAIVRIFQFSHLVHCRSLWLNAWSRWTLMSNLSIWPHILIERSTLLYWELKYDNAGNWVWQLLQWGQAFTLWHTKRFVYYKASTSEKERFTISEMCSIFSLHPKAHNGGGRDSLRLCIVQKRCNLTKVQGNK